MLVLSCLLSNLFSVLSALLCMYDDGLMAENYLPQALLPTDIRKIQRMGGIGRWPGGRRKGKSGHLFPFSLFQMTSEVILCSLHGSSFFLTDLSFSVSSHWAASTVVLLSAGHPHSLSWVAPALRLVVASCFGTDHMLLGFSALPTPL